MQILCCATLVTEGLPLPGRERGYQDDILAGADFLSFFMGSNLRRAYRGVERSTFPTVTITDLRAMESIRESRSTSYVSQPFTEDPTGFGTKLVSESTISDYSAQLEQKPFNNSQNSKQSSESSADPGDGVVVAVRVSSSVGKPLVRRVPIKKTALGRKTIKSQLPAQADNFLASEERPSIVAEANKSEFSVDEVDPITSNSELPSKDYGQEYPADVRSYPNTQAIGSYSTPEYTDPEKAKEKLEPIHHQTLIYHNNPREPGRARSVSYSTVIQALPQSLMKSEHLDRQERHYDGTQGAYANSYDAYQQKDVPKPYSEYTESVNSTQPQEQRLPQGSMAETKDFYVTSKYNPSDYNESTEKLANKHEHSWKKVHDIYSQGLPRKDSDHTENNWEPREKTYSPHPTAQTSRTPLVYAQPEQNYEIDESVSVITNGRTHGVQTLKNLAEKMPSATPALDGKTVEATTDADGQKVGYVVEGRNYRKYRVEERTSDGFIVGEYGVVSHNDGTLRGVRYTADGTINPRLIYDALMKFLSL